MIHILRKKRSGIKPVPVHTATRVDDQLELLVALRNDHVRNLAILANGLSPETLTTITTMIERARQLEGLA